MIAFVRLMELAGQPILLERLTPSQAKAIFVQHGAPEASFSNADNLKAAWKKLILANHPDRGGDVNVAKEINAAFDVLKASPMSSGSTSSSSSPDDRDHSSSEYPAWAKAGYSGGTRNSSTIYRQNYTDMNYIKKRMWELSGKFKEEWTLWGFDGHFFRNTLTVYGSPKIFSEMGIALRDWQKASMYKCRAVLANQKYAPDEMHVIYIEGCDLSGLEEFPVLFTEDSINMNPGNDQGFTRRLPAMLDTIMKKQDDQRAAQDRRDRSNARADAEAREWQASKRARNENK